MESTQLGGQWVKLRSEQTMNDGESYGKGDGNWKCGKCYQCGKLGYIRKNCNVKSKDVNVVEKEVESKGDEE